MMTKPALARNLAHSLTRADWSPSTLSQTLRQRLPSALHPLSNRLVDHLLSALPSLYAPPPARVAAELARHDDFARIHGYCMFHDTWPVPDLRSAEMTPVKAFRMIDVPALTNRKDLADWLLMDVAQLDRLADRQNRAERHGDMAVNHYHRRLIPKQGGALRLLEAPKQRLKTVQRRILRGLLDRLPPHPDAFGFVPGRNCLGGANRHVGEAMVVHFDIETFFPSITAGRVYGVFRCLGYPHQTSQCLTGLCTTATPPDMLNRLPFAQRAALRIPHLPQGAPTSPALANQLCHGLDRRLSALAQSLGAQYSRYADDLTFSGDRHIARPLLKLVPEIAASEGFRLNARKTRAMPDSARQMVTGVVVNRHLNTRRQHYDRLKAVIHACGKADDNRLADAAFRTALLGRIAWVEQVNPARAQKLRHQLHDAWHRRFTQARSRQ